VEGPWTDPATGLGRFRQAQRDLEASRNSSAAADYLTKKTSDRLLNHASSSAVVRFLDYGSWVRGDYTADSDADLIVVVRRDFSGILNRSPYQIHTRAIPTDSLAYSEREFEELSRDPSSFLARNLSGALEL
jgi:hypothetical protein